MYNTVVCDGIMEAKVVLTIEILHLEPTCRLPYIHGLCSSMVCTWRLLVEKFCILFWQARVDREIERYESKGRGNEKGAGGIRRALKPQGGLGRHSEQLDVPPWVSIS
jgi:hypothetical protein